jgi:acetyl-CoA carboxylase carboxyl transferase subunit beta
VLDHGFLDFIVNRKELKQQLTNLLLMLRNPAPEEKVPATPKKKTVKA